VISPAVNPFYHRIAAEEGEFALVELPMGRQESKIYMYYQTVHGRPIVEGLSARTPESAYDYIEANPLLASWRAGRPLECRAFSEGEMSESLQRLAEDSFRYVVVHHDGGRVPAAFAGYLTAPPVFQDEELSAYAVADLLARPLCSAGP
jgi:hypothetical protein